MRRIEGHEAACMSGRRSAPLLSSIHARDHQALCGRWRTTRRRRADPSRFPWSAATFFCVSSRCASRSPLSHPPFSTTAPHAHQPPSCHLMFRRAAPALASLAKRALACEALPASTTAASTRWAPTAAAVLAAAREPSWAVARPFSAAPSPPSPPSPAAKNHTGWGQTKVSELLDFKVGMRVGGGIERGRECCERAGTPRCAPRERRCGGSQDAPPFPSSSHPALPPLTQGNDRGAWLWCSKGDMVIDAVKKVREGEREREERERASMRLAGRRPGAAGLSLFSFSHARPGSAAPPAPLQPRPSSVWGPWPIGGGCRSEVWGVAEVWVEVGEKRRTEGTRDGGGRLSRIPFFFSPPSLSQQMAKANVGSLLVFDPATMGVEGPLPADAVVGIVTERGELRGEGCERDEQKIGARGAEGGGVLLLATVLRPSRSTFRPQTSAMGATGLSRIARGRSGRC